MSAAAPTRDDALRAIVAATTDALTADPEKGAVVFHASGTGGEGVRTHLRVGRHTVLVDEPPALGGVDDAPNPVETALAGLLSCQVVTLDGPAERERYEELAATVDAHCPVLDLYCDATPVTTTVRTA